MNRPTANDRPDSSPADEGGTPAGDGSGDAGEHEATELEEAERQDPDAPALGAIEDGEGLPDPPEPQEPG